MAKTPKPDVTIIDCETGETIVRPMTDEEYAAWLPVEVIDEATIS